MSRRPRRRPPSRTRLATRRVVALGILLGVVAGVGWGATRIASNGHESAPPATTSAVQRKSGPLRIVFPEGFTRGQMAERIAAVNKIARQMRRVRTRLSPHAYLRLTARSGYPRTFGGAEKTRSLEGFLFPALYEFTPQTTTRQLVDDQLEAFRRTWRRVNLGYARSKNLKPYDVLIIASMIEKEVRVPAERRLVAAVIYNRLRRRMRLQIDATVRYGLHVPPTESLRASQLKSRNPYNTRVHFGLPPTPIANPGLASMQAAAHPAHVDYLYFVRKPDKIHHFFTASERAFIRYQRKHGY